MNMFVYFQDSRVVNMVKFYPCLLFCIGLESGQHVEILIRSIILDSRVVNMLRFNGYVLLFRILRMVNMFKFYPCLSLAVDSRVVDMLMF